MDNRELQSLIEAEQQKRLRRDWALSPEERIERFIALQNAA